VKGTACDTVDKDGWVEHRPSHILFDLDGTLADSSAGILGSFRVTLDQIGIPANEDQLRRLIGPPLGESFRILGVAPADIDDVVELYRDSYAQRGVYEAHLYDGVATTLESLHAQGVHLGVATAKRVDFARLMLESLGVAHLFDAINGASLDLLVTSKFDIMTPVLDGWRFEDGLDVWMVGDRNYDMVAARTHGLSAVGATWGFGSAQELREAGAHWLIERPSDLLLDPSTSSRAEPLNDVLDE
jgi:phosphoglycolate phosphatase